MFLIQSEALAKSCDKFKGDLMDFETVYNFGKQVDVLTLKLNW
jgi:hypothetical protein